MGGRLAIAGVIALAALTATSAAAAHSDSGTRAAQAPREISGLRATPGRAVASLALRPGQAAHHAVVRAAKPGTKCDKDIDRTGAISGVSFVGAQDNRICTNADIDVYTTGTGTPYVVQAGGQEAAWTHTNVTDPTRPAKVGQFVWSGRGGKSTYTPDVKAFRQGSSHYIAMGLERTTLAGYCGVVIVNVTDPANPVLEDQFIGADWCDTHNVFVESDANGDGRYIYATADRTSDMRVLAVAGTWSGQTATVSNPIEIGRYRAPTANSDNYVHDVTVVDHGTAGRRAYLSYWDSGLVILDAADVTPGTDPAPLVGPNVIDPANFLTHHAYPNAAGTRVFIEDEMTYTAGFEPVQMWNVSDLAAPAYVAGIGPGVGAGGELLPAHNLHVDGNVLYVGWYKGGMQAFSFTEDGITGRVAYHQVQTEAADDVYDGAWGVRLLDIGGQRHVFQSDRRYGLIIARF